MVDWGRRYDEAIAALPRLVAASRMTLCGLNACIDARVRLHDLPAAVAGDDPQVERFVGMLLERVRAGVGGEVFVEWPEGPAWLAAQVPIRTALGGTGPHAAWVLSCLGAPALLCLGDRSAFMLSHLPPGVMLAEAGRAVPAEAVAPHGDRRPAIFIFEYTAGQPIRDVVPERSSRIIVRFHNPGLERDPAFETTSAALAAGAGAGLVAGFNAVPPATLADEIARVRPTVEAWRAAGLATVHLELAGYDTPDLAEQVLASLRGLVTSVGMSQSELVALQDPADDPQEAMLRFAARTGVTRVVVHADHWAAAVTRGDAFREAQALMTGCLLAGARAAAGQPVVPTGIDPAARYHALPFPERRTAADWTFVACASPYLDHPVTTLGLGDTFTAGCLLALGQGVEARS